MVRRAACIALLAALPAMAGAPGRDEDLAMRLIFDDCLAYARDGRPPFAGVAEPAPEDAMLAALAPFFPASARALRLTAPEAGGQPYLAFWGSEDGRRFCAVVEAVQDAPDGLRVAPGFLERLDAKAQDEGLVIDMNHEAYSRRDARWREPQHAEDPFRGLVLSASVGPIGSETEHVQALGASGPELLAN